MFERPLAPRQRLTRSKPAKNSGMESFSSKTKRSSISSRQVYDLIDGVDTVELNFIRNFNFRFPFGNL